MKKVAMILFFVFLAEQLFFPRRAAAQLYLPANLPPVPENRQYDAWNLASLLNAVVAAVLAGNSDVDLDAAFVVNTVNGDFVTAKKYAPLQNGFYLNHLGFESEITRGLTLFGEARNQDAFNKEADLRVRDGSLKYDLAYEKLVNWQVAPAYLPNSMAVDATAFLGWPDAPGFPQIFIDDPVNFDLPGFNRDAGYYPRVSDDLVNTLHYTYANGLGFFASNRLRSMTGSYLLEDYGIQGTAGIDNNLSQTTAGLDYTSPQNVQFYAADTFQNWNNKQNTGYVGLPLAVAPIPFYVIQLPPYGSEAPCFPDGPGGSCFAPDAPLSVPNFKADDTFWNTDQAGFRVPLSKSMAFSGSWKVWEKSSAGVFGSGLYSDVGFSPAFSAALIEGSPGAASGLLPTGQEPEFTVRQYRGRLDVILGKSDAAVFNFGHWEETPNESVLHETLRRRNNAFLSYRHSFRNQTVSLFGGWEQETIRRTIDFRELRIWDAFNPILNRTFDSNFIGTATYNGATISFAPYPGAPFSPFTTLVNPFCGFGCGTNLTVYPVGGIAVIPAGLPFAGSYPVVAPLGIQSFTGNSYVAKFSASGSIFDTVDYDFSLERDLADKTMFRIDPQDMWKDHFELTWEPIPRLSIDSSLDTEDNRSNAQWLYPYASHENDFTLVADYDVSRDVGVFAQFSNFTQKFGFTSPVLNTSSENFLGPPTFGPFGPVQTVGSGLDLNFVAPFAQYLALPADSIQDDVSDQDQEISVGARLRLDDNWSAKVSYARSRPQTFQNLFLTSPITSGSPFGPFVPNAPFAFSTNLPELLVMQAVDGRRNDYALHLSRLLPDGARLGMLLELDAFRNLAPRVTAISVACGAPGTPTFCANGIPYGQNAFLYGSSLNNGQVFTTAVFYNRNF